MPTWSRVVQEADANQGRAMPDSLQNVRPTQLPIIGLTGPSQ